MNNLEKYIEDFSEPLPEALNWLDRQTHLRTNYPHMLCGPEVGRLLTMMVRMLRPQRVLEIGTFTGYSAICLAAGLPEGGTLDALEINDELEDLIREGFARAGVSDRIRLQFGDALQILPTLPEQSYDLVYLDANKRAYPAFLPLILRCLREGGWLVADNVLWGGKVCDDSSKETCQTRGILDFNAAVAADPRLESFILPLRDGLNIIRLRQSK